MMGQGMGRLDDVDVSGAVDRGFGKLHLEKAADPFFFKWQVFSGECLKMKEDNSLHKE